MSEHLDTRNRMNHQITVPNYDNTGMETITVHMYPSEKVIKIFEDKMKELNKKNKGKKKGYKPVDIFDAAKQIFINNYQSGVKEHLQKAKDLKAQQNNNNATDEAEYHLKVANALQTRLREVEKRYPFTHREDVKPSYQVFKTIPGVLIRPGSYGDKKSLYERMQENTFIFPEYDMQHPDGIKWTHTSICPWCGEEHDMSVFTDPTFKQNHSQTSHDEYYGKVRVGKLSKPKKNSGKKKKPSMKKKPSGKKNPSMKKKHGAKKKPDKYEEEV